MANSKIDEDAPRIYVACLAAYNNGKLHGAWIDATLGEDHINDEIEQMLASSPEAGAEEWSIHDYDNFGVIKLDENEDLELVAQLAGLIEEHGELFAEVYSNYGSVESAVEALTEHYHGAWDELADWAEELLEEQLKDLPSSLRSYFDFEGYAERELLLDGYSEYVVGGKHHIFSDF